MKLITEQVNDLSFIIEETDGKKQLFIEGVFLQSDVKNKNGRMYPKKILEREVKRYNEQYVKTKRAFGELGHPDGPVINLERVSHMVTELNEDGKDFVGKAKIMTSTPYGKIVEGLLNEGAQLGVSSRGMGTLKKEKGADVVQDDFYLATAADIVADPSAPNAFVEGIMEGKEWIYENGVFREEQLAEFKKDLDNTSRFSKDREKKILESFERFFSEI
tara:strand:+ start:60 stop:713 length:654 start_codon:yes stop_codon:yes gene_type:complete